MDRREQVVGDGVRRQIRVAASLGSVWRAVATPEGLAAWLGATSVELDPHADRPILVRWPDGSASRGLVEEVEAPHRFVFRWRRLAEGYPGLSVGAPTRVCIEVASDREGSTVVTVTESPWTPAGPRSGRGAGLEGDLVEVRP